MKKKIVILGSTGSIGKSLLNIIDKDTQEEYINKSKVEVAKIIIKKVLKNLI